MKYSAYVVPTRGQRGVTILELAIVVSLMLVAFFLTAVSIEYFRKNSILSAAVEDVFTTVSSAQSKTVAGENARAYKVHFSSSQVQLLRDDNLLLGQTNVDRLLQIVPPASDITFTKVTGYSNGGTIVIRLKDLSNQKSIIVSQQGKITIQ